MLSALHVVPACRGRMSKQSNGSGSVCYQVSSQGLQALGYASAIHDRLRAVITLATSPGARQICPFHDSILHSVLESMSSSASWADLVRLQGQDEREQQVRADLAAEKEQLRKHHDRELRTLREQYENSQVPCIITAWFAVLVRVWGAYAAQAMRSGAEGPALG